MKQRQAGDIRGKRQKKRQQQAQPKRNSAIASMFAFTDVQDLMEVPDLDPISEEEPELEEDNDSTACSPTGHSLKW